jgi:hypothetical protein
MGFLDRLFGRSERAALPTLSALMQGRGLPSDLIGLESLKPTFDHLDSAEAREAWVEAVATLHEAKIELPKTWESVQEDILPELVPAWRAEREGAWSQLFIEGLHQRLVVDGQAIPQNVITLWGLPEAEIQDRALDNLRRKTEARPFERLPSGIYKSTWNDGLDAVRLLLPETWDAHFKDQSPFMAIPTPGTMIVAPQILLPKLVDATVQIIQSKDELLQAALLQRVGDKWLPAKLQDPHPMANAQRELRQVDLLQALRVQDQDLDPALGRPTPVMMLTTQQGRTLLMARWIEGEACLLPETDLVGFMTKDGKPLGIYWRSTLPRMPLKGTPVDIWGPRRQRFERFPIREDLGLLERWGNAEQMTQVLNEAAQRATQPKVSEAPKKESQPSQPNPVLQNPSAPPLAKRPAKPAPSAQFSTQPVPTLPRHLKGQLGIKDEDED